MWGCHSIVTVLHSAWSMSFVIGDHYTRSTMESCNTTPNTDILADPAVTTKFEEITVVVIVIITTVVMSRRGGIVLLAQS